MTQGRRHELKNVRERYRLLPILCVERLDRRLRLKRRCHAVRAPVMLIYVGSLHEVVENIPGFFTGQFRESFDLKLLGSVFCKEAIKRRFDRKIALPPRKCTAVVVEEKLRRHRADGRQCFRLHDSHFYTPSD